MAAEGGVDLATLGMSLQATEFRREGEEVERLIDNISAAEKRAVASTNEFEAATRNASRASAERNNSLSQEERAMRNVAERARVSAEAEREWQARRRADMERSAREAAQLAATAGREQAKAQVAAMEAEFKFSMAVIKEEQARGFITPAEAGERGRQAAQAYNTGVLEQIAKTGGSGGFSGSSGRESFTSLAGGLKNVDDASRTASAGVGRLNFTLASLLRQATGTHPAVSQLANVLGSLAVGSAAMVGILGGLAALSFAYRELTEDSRDLKTAQEEATEALRQLAAAQEIADRGPGGETAGNLANHRARMELLSEEIARLRSIDQGGIAGNLPALGLAQQYQEEYDELLALVEAGERDVTEQRDRANEERARNAEAAARARQAAEEREERERRQRWDERERDSNLVLNVIAEARRERDANIASSQERIDTMLVEVDQQERLIEALAKGKDAQNELRVAIAGENAERQLKGKATPAQIAQSKALAEEQARNAITIEEVTAALKEQARAQELADKAEQERIRTLREEVRLGEEYARSAIQMADALGILGESASKNLQALVQVAGAMARLGGDDPTALPLLIGGSASLLAGLFGGGPSAAEQEREAEELKRSLDALKDATDRLRETYSGTPSGLRSSTFAALEPLLAGGLGVDSLLNRELRDSARIQPRSPQVRETIAEHFAALERIEASYALELQARLAAAEGREREAERLRFQMRQEEEMFAARAAQWDATLLAQLEVVQGEEALAFARRQEAEAAEEAVQAAKDLAQELAALATFRADLFARGLAATGQGGAAAGLRLSERHRQERLAFGQTGGTQADSDFLAFIHSLEVRDLELTQHVAEQTAAIQEAANAQIAALNAQRAILQDQLRLAQESLRAQETLVRDTQRALESVTRFGQGLLVGPSTVLSPFAQLEESRRQFEEQLALAQGGDNAAAGGLSSFAQQLLDASRNYNASGSGFVADFIRVQETIAALEGQLGSRLTVEEQILQELQSHTDSLAAEILILQSQIDSIRQAAADEIAALNAWAAEQRANWEEELRIARAQLAATLRLDEALENYTPFEPPDGRGGDTGFVPLIAEVQASNVELRATVRLLSEGFLGSRERQDRTEAAISDLTREVKRLHEVPR